MVAAAASLHAARMVRSYTLATRPLPLTDSLARILITDCGIGSGITHRLVVLAAPLPALACPSNRRTFAFVLTTSKASTANRRTGFSSLDMPVFNENRHCLTFVDVLASSSTGSGEGDVKNVCNARQKLNISERHGEPMYVVCGRLHHRSTNSLTFRQELSSLALDISTPRVQPLCPVRALVLLC